MKTSEMCQSCMMPLAKDTGTRESDKYCSKCFSGGKLNGDGMTLKEFQKVSYDRMVADGMSPMKAKFFVWMMRFAPRWKK